jgi:fructokinase
MSTKIYGREGDEMAQYGGIELGGTKCVCAVGDGSQDAWEATVIPTSSPEVTVERATEWFRGVQARSGPLRSLGVACFGPLDLDRGAIASATPKLAWRGWPVRQRFEDALGVPVKLDTDVNAAARAEWAWGAAQGCSDMLYVTIGTGIGVGAIVHGAVVCGRSHPEMGHMRIPQHYSDCQPGVPGTMWEGNCVIHGNCWEGLASGPARAKRAEIWAEAGTKGPDATSLESEYIALGLVNLISAYRPERLVIGGGVLHESALLPRIRKRAAELLDVGYFPEALEIDELVVKPGLGDAAGVSGAILLASQLRPGNLPSRFVGALTSLIEEGLTKI